MDCSCCCDVSPVISFFVSFVFLAFPVRPVLSSISVQRHQQFNQTFHPGESHNLEKITDYLMKINKPPVKSIQSPDGDLIDCVLSNNQPAFDHPHLQGHGLLDPPAFRPKGDHHQKTGTATEDFQWWSLNGESCPEGTVPIRRTTEQDVLRETSVHSFGRKPRRTIRPDTFSSGHEHAVGVVTGGQYYGAKASINVWSPYVANQNEFSLSQIWITSGSVGRDVNTIEAGWQVCPKLYGDKRTRLFTYWTSDNYQGTGCYNLLCSGFVQTSNKIAIGAAISPLSSFNGQQFEISLMIWKDPKHGNWWLELGSGTLIGYWPSAIFTQLKSHASMVQFGGEIVNSKSQGIHTSTQMGSGHFATEGSRKASYFRSLQVVDWDNSLIPPSNLQLLADHPACYNIRGGINNVWGHYFYFGGPGYNPTCH